MPDYRDIRLRDDARTVPPSIVQAYQLDGANITALETGSYNVHFKIEHEDQAYDVRKSNRPNNAGNLEYEAEVLNHLEKNGFALAPKIVPEASGKPNLWIDDTGWTLFRWMGDGAPAGKPLVNSARIHNASIVLADIHRVGRAFVPSGSRPNWPIFTLPDVDPRIWLTRAKHLAGELGVDGSELAEFAKKSANELNSVDFTQLPEYLCHGDYRMRNLQFTGDEVLESSISTLRFGREEFLIWAAH